ncbi:helix-turn-helix transcriptional regulator [Rothia sp. AR01]|uniref:Helix-turn-helix transcriptional regulator n=1 Tax=Rothia santali TaxID=2949643 RepID=A0A9X2HET2_9MICC|nr:helix-turn-helix transcriptional regulator [Rothia santali]MCP3426387.1 helix-turn-helix transcriptional regulator [Rothia santali]
MPDSSTTPRGRTGRGDAPSPIRCHLDEVLAARGMTLTELSREAGISVTNLSLLKNNHVRAIRYSTLEALCRVLDCQPGDLLTHLADGEDPA